MDPVFGATDNPFHCERTTQKAWTSRVRRHLRGVELVPVFPLVRRAYVRGSGFPEQRGLCHRDHAMALTSYTAGLSMNQVEILRDLLDRHGFDFSAKDYAFFAATKGKLHVTAYEKGPKVLVQGKETEDFVRFLLEPEVLGEAKLGYEEVWNAEMFEPHFGIDESGKGDLFGPLVIAGVYTNEHSTRQLMDAGIMDSKCISSTKRIKELATVIRQHVGDGFKVIRWAPQKYNDLYQQMGNVNRMLARGHARAIQDLHRRYPSCPRALCDQFSRSGLIQKELKRMNLSLTLDERTKAESDLAVAAASILARESFLDWIEKVSQRTGVDVPLGAGARTTEAAREFANQYGPDCLQDLVKAHFRNLEDL